MLSLQRDLSLPTLADMRVCDPDFARANPSVRPSYNKLCTNLWHGKADPDGNLDWGSSAADSFQSARHNALCCVGAWLAIQGFQVGCQLCRRSCDERSHRYVNHAQAFQPLRFDVLAHIGRAIQARLSRIRCRLSICHRSTLGAWVRTDSYAKYIRSQRHVKCDMFIHTPILEPPEDARLRDLFAEVPS